MELFKRHKADGDYDAASTVMLGWAQEAGKRHNLWFANMACLLFAFKSGLHEEALQRAEELKNIDADDPYTLEMIARIYEAQGRHDEAVASAEKAVKSATADAEQAAERGKPEDPSILKSYEDYLAQLTTKADDGR
jgi:tetratricopeptide (TPR) repeat protein